MDGLDEMSLIRVRRRTWKVVLIGFSTDQKKKGILRLQEGFAGFL
jgi:hypothetical protein